MAKRLLVYLTLATLLNLILGCSSIVKRSFDEVSVYSDPVVTAVGQYPLSIKLTDLDYIYVMQIRDDAEGEGVRDTIAADQFRSEIVTRSDHRITAVEYKNGRRLEFDDREVSFDSSSEEIQVAGTETVFSRRGGRMDPASQSIGGRSKDGDSVSIAFEDVAYVRVVEQDGGKQSIQLITMLLGMAAIAAVIYVMFYAAEMDDLGL
jgi:hypothetical protein